MKLLNSLSLAAAAALTLLAGAAQAESQYGYASSGIGQVTAQARVNLSVTVPKLILLRVGAAGTDQAQLNWTTPLTIATGPTALINGSNQDANWGGAAPSVGTIANPTAVSVYAWTNSSGGGRLNYAATPFAANGPTLANISVNASTGGLAHPGVALATAGTAVDFTKNTLHTGSWTYVLDGTGAAGWEAGAYTSIVTYTATSL